MARDGPLSLSQALDTDLVGPVKVWEINSNRVKKGGRCSRLRCANPRCHSLESYLFAVTKPVVQDRL